MSHSAPAEIAVLRHHAKTFFWAWLFLPRRNRATIAKLYAFCRAVDDMADETNDRDGLRALRERVAVGADDRAREFEAAGVTRAWLLDLIDGARSDVDFKGIADETELDLYCYRVAGVVGLMMCPLLGVTAPAAHQHAVDLGSAMQLTNIARDVAEDLRRGRTYVPRTWGDADTPFVTRRLLRKAECLYAHGRAGLSFIPGRSRLAIAVASALYRDIGRSIARRGFDPRAGRAHVSRPRKLVLILMTLFQRKAVLRELESQSKSDVDVRNLAWLR